MRRITLVFSALVLLGCGSEGTAPQDSFAGTWTGSTHGLNFTIVTTQTGNSISGDGMWVADAGGTQGFTVDGVATPLRFTMRSSPGDNQPFYVGRYVAPDSVVGTIDNGGGSTAELSLKKQ
jgi:hypothetical protein